jgi:hypothetical protein
VVIIIQQIFIWIVGRLIRKGFFDHRFPEIFLKAIHALTFFFYFDHFVNPIIQFFLKDLKKYLFIFIADLIPLLTLFLHDKVRNVLNKNGEIVLGSLIVVEEVHQVKQVLLGDEEETYTDYGEG